MKTFVQYCVAKIYAILAIYSSILQLIVENIYMNDEDKMGVRALRKNSQSMIFEQNFPFNSSTSLLMYGNWPCV